MHRVSTSGSAASPDLRQHFHNYFELLLGAERSKLQHAIVGVDEQYARHEVLIEIDCRINYLRGAVRMGKLLCLIDQEEANASFNRLSSERDRLRASALGKHDDVHRAPKSSRDGMRIDLIKKSLQSTN